MIRAVGMEFNVLRRSSGTAVSVLQGVVQVPAARLTAGEEARIAPDGRIGKRVPVDVVAVFAWRQHRLVFRADDPRTFMEYLRGDAELALEEGADELVIRMR